ncbi:MAG: DUF1353 domain-containing protein [Tenacibaculum sp.]|nr:DUF1353 domain-containing protein [Tenacibaculum sp.]
MKLNFLEQPKYIPIQYLPNEKGERTFEVTEDIDITLSDGYVLKIEKGFKTDLASIPKFLWSILSPIDSGFIGDLLHDKLWVDKIGQIQHFDNNLYKARLFADNERLIWRNKIAPKKKFKNYLTHYVIRLIGGFFYSKQIQIPT